MTRKHLRLFFRMVISMCMPWQIVTAQTDSAFYVPIDPLLKKLISLNTKCYPMGGPPQSILKLQEPIFKEKAQQVTMTDDNLYIQLEGTGRLYKATKQNDSILKFTRIDKTVSINYNGGGYLFTEGENIYIFGGYGFWKSNGTFKKFNFRDKEWDVFRVSKELFPPGYPHPGAWYDIQSNKMHLLIEEVVNDALRNSNKEGNSSHATHEMDLKTRTWVESLSLHDRVRQMIKNRGPVVQYNNGYLMLDKIDLYDVDIRNNQLRKMSDQSFSQTFSRIFNNEFIFWHDNKVFFRDKNTGKLDSLVLPIDKFATEPFPVFQRTIPEYVKWMSLIILLIAGTAYAYSRIDRNPNLKNAGFHASAAGFSETEISLIQMLIEKSKKQLRADIHDLNYVLGVKDKNTGLQKKVRSDAIRNINEKFLIISGTEDPLISIERSAADKRYFEYFIDRHKIRIASTFITKN